MLTQKLLDDAGLSLPGGLKALAKAVPFFDVLSELLHPSPKKRE